MNIKLTVPGEPKGKQRPRWHKFGTYTPTETVNYETYIKELFTIKYPDFIPLESTLEMELCMFLSIPKSTGNKKKELMRTKAIQPGKRPDIDNVLKVVCDALEKLAYKNDSQIVDVVATKEYSERPRLEIKISHSPPIFKEIL